MSDSTTVLVEMRELDAGCGRVVRVAAWRSSDGAPIAYAVTTGYAADSAVWQRTDDHVEIPVALVRAVAAALLALEGSP